MARALVTLVTPAGRITPPADFDPAAYGIEPAELRALVSSGYVAEGEGEAPSPEPQSTESASEPAAASAPEPEEPAQGEAGESTEAEGEEPTGHEERLAAILEATELLDRDNPDHYTKTGKPEVSALADVLGWRPTAAERDEAVAE